MSDDAAEIAVLLVDDQDLVRSGLRRILRRKDGFTIVAECSDGDEVPDAVARHRADVVVMDLRMKRVDGIAATRLLSGRGGPPVLALTTFNDDELLSGALRAGRVRLRVEGFLGRGTDPRRSRGGPRRQLP